MESPMTATTSPSRSFWSWARVKSGARRARQASAKRFMRELLCEERDDVIVPFVKWVATVRGADPTGESVTICAMRAMTDLDLDALANELTARGFKASHARGLMRS